MRGVRLLSAAATLALSGLSGACMAPFGVGWQREQAVTPSNAESHSQAARDLPPTDNRPRIYLLGQAQAGPAAQSVAQHLGARLRADKEAGRETNLLWLGDTLPGPQPQGACPTVAEALAQPGLRELAQLGRTQLQEGGASWGLNGYDDNRCERELEKIEGPIYRRPNPSYLLELRDGQLSLVRSCDASGCRLQEEDGEQGFTGEPPLLQLAVMDLSDWFAPAGDPSPRRQRGPYPDPTLELEAATNLRNSLGEREPAEPPLLLLSHVPVESVGTHGLGGRIPDSTLGAFPHWVQEDLVGGLYAGVLSSRERNLQATADLSDAVARSSRTFLDYPVFQVVSGGAGRTDARAWPAPRGRRWTWGQALIPDLRSSSPGYAELRVGKEELEIVLHTRRASRWLQAGFSVPLRPEALPETRVLPPMTPCLRCDPQDGAAQGIRGGDLP